MKILEVTFDCTIAMPGYNNKKPGVLRAILEEGDTLEGAWSELNRRAEAWHRKEYPELYPQPTFPHVPLSSSQIGDMSKARANLTVIDKSIERLEIQIDNANTLEELDKILLSYDKLPSGIIEQIEKKKDFLTPRTDYIHD